MAAGALEVAASALNTAAVVSLTVPRATNAPGGDPLRTDIVKLFSVAGDAAPPVVAVPVGVPIGEPQLPPSATCCTCTAACGGDFGRGTAFCWRLDTMSARRAAATIAVAADKAGVVASTPCSVTLAGCLAQAGHHLVPHANTQRASEG